MSHSSNNPDEVAGFAGRAGRFVLHKAGRDQAAGSPKRTKFLLPNRTANESYSSQYRLRCNTHCNIAARIAVA
jgi:hypothetical protein